MPRMPRRNNSRSERSERPENRKDRKQRRAEKKSVRAVKRAAKFDTGGVIPHFKNPANEHQAIAWDILEQHRITFLLGPAGTGKSYLAIANALQHLIVNGDVKKLKFCRPAVEAGENLGFLPGDLKKKVDPYMLPLYDCMEEMVGSVGRLKEQVNSVLETAPVAYLRGRTFKDSFILLDEAQNCTEKQLKLVLTRIGLRSRMIITGDPAQSDLSGGENPLARLIHRLKESGVLERGNIGLYHFPNRGAVIRDEIIDDVQELFGD